MSAAPPAPSADFQYSAEPALRLRVAFLAGTLGQGGAEKQLIYMTRALRQSNVAVQVYSLGQGEFYDAVLREMNVEAIRVGQRDSRLLRLGAFVQALRVYRPHLVQSGHFFCNLYVALAARLVGALAVGAIRNDVRYEVEKLGRWGRWQLRLPESIIANSQAAANNLESLGVPAAKCHVVPNVIDLAEFDAGRGEGDTDVPRTESPVVVTVGRLDRAKRFDRFLDVVSLARESMPRLRGMIIGEGPERAALEARAQERGLLPEGLQFLGWRLDVPFLLRQANIFLLTSENEGSPNVLLEAMAARLPVVTTPAGESGRVVTDGMTGYVVDHGDLVGMAQRVLQLAGSPRLQRRLGDAGRRDVEQRFSYAGFAHRLMVTYRRIAEERDNRRALEACLASGG